MLCGAAGERFCGIMPNPLISSKMNKLQQLAVRASRGVRAMASSTDVYQVTPRRSLLYLPGHDVKKVGLIVCFIFIFCTMIDWQPKNTHSSDEVKHIGKYHQSNK